MVTAAAPGPGDAGATGWIQPHALEELWFHTGTACNLACPFCLEGSRPGDARLGRITLAEVRPFIEEALALGVRQFSFTGGEPFVVRDMVRILELAASHRPCLVLTNGSEALLKRLPQIGRLRDSRCPVSFRVSIDWPDEARHDEGRGDGQFRNAWQSLRALHERGFGISVARQAAADEDSAATDEAYRALFRRHGLPADTRIVAFPDFGVPGERRAVPQITERCMTTFQTAETRRAFMCAFSKMIVKSGGRLRVYPCTLVDDDPAYDQGASLREALAPRVMLNHHRCYSCFRFGSSCSEL